MNVRWYHKDFDKHSIASKITLFRDYYYKWQIVHDFNANIRYLVDKCNLNVHNRNERLESQGLVVQQQKLKA